MSKLEIFMMLMAQHQYEMTIEDILDLKYWYDDGVITTKQRMIDAGILN
jgi:hypothetical protein